MNSSIKKACMLLILISLCTTLSAAVPSEHWLFTGFDYEFTIISSDSDKLHALVGDDDISYLNSLGFDVTWYGFWGKDSHVGVFSSLGMLFPMENGKEESQDQSLNQASNTHTTDLVFSVMLGPAFRAKPMSNLDVYMGIGLRFDHHLFTEVNTQGNTTKEGTSSLGMALDAGFKFGVTKRLCFRVGVSSSFDFAVMYSKTVTGASGIAVDPPINTLSLIKGFTLTPYVGMGITLKTPAPTKEPQTYSILLGKSVPTA